jgi:hypothetical protein
MDGDGTREKKKWEGKLGIYGMGAMLVYELSLIAFSWLGVSGLCPGLTAYSGHQHRKREAPAPFVYGTRPICKEK